jgi:hypothetical protein
MGNRALSGPRIPAAGSAYNQPILQPIGAATVVNPPIMCPLFPYKVIFLFMHCAYLGMVRAEILTVFSHPTIMDVISPGC